MPEQPRFETRLKTAERSLCVLARSTQIPKYCRQRRKDRNSDIGYVRLNGIRHSLGPYGSESSIQEYRCLVSEWLTNGCLPVADPESLTVNGLIGRFMQYADAEYRDRDGNRTKTFGLYQMALRPVSEHCGHAPAAAFSNRRFREIRDIMLGTDRWCRTTLNSMGKLIISVFRWGAAESLVPPHIYQALRAEKPLRKGRTPAREMPPVRPVAWEQIEAILPLVSDEIAALLQLHYLMGCRSDEITSMRPVDINKTGEVDPATGHICWIFTPEHHKTEHFEDDLEYFIPPDGQALLKPFLDGCQPCSPVFSPQNAEARRIAAGHTARVTPLKYGNRPGTNRVRSRRRPPGERYTTASYRRAVQRACEMVWPTPSDIRDDKRAAAAWRKQNHFTPHQIRHRTATDIRELHGLETASAYIGHNSVDVTQIYAEKNRMKSISVAAVRRLPSSANGQVELSAR